MSWLTQSFSGTVGRKIVMALSGMFLITFLVVHLVLNLFLLECNGSAFNAICDFMDGNPVIRALELVLFAGFIIHIVYSAILTLHNRNSRGPDRYAVTNPGANSTSLSATWG